MAAPPRSIGVVLPPDEQAVFPQALQASVARSGRPLRVVPDAAPEAVDYLVWNVDSGVTDFAPYTRLRAILNTWAGVEGVVGRITWPAHVPFVRMVESGMNEGMAEYFAAHALRYHLDIDRAQAQSAEGRWEKWEPPLARDRTVGILGLGALGSAVAAMLRADRLPRPRLVAHGQGGAGRRLPARAGRAARGAGAGRDPGAGAAADAGDPGPAERRDAGAAAARRLPHQCRARRADRRRGAAGGAGSGRLRHATLDVFRDEPLPADHPFWRHPRITVTPHIAALTRPGTASEAIVAQIGRDLDGLALQHVVDPARGY